MLAMALLLHGGLLGGMGGEAAGVDGSGEGAWTLATPAEGFLVALGTGELAHLLHLCLFRAFARGARIQGKSHEFEGGPNDHFGPPYNFTCKSSYRGREISPGNHSQAPEHNQFSSFRESY
jgi:hypothetical protein